MLHSDFKYRFQIMESEIKAFNVVFFILLAVKPGLTRIKSPSLEKKKTWPKKVGQDPEGITGRIRKKP